MNWLRKFMYGRYGSDQLNMALLILSIALTVVFWFVPVGLLGYLGFIPIIICFYRMFSKNITKRQQENYVFLKWWYNVKSKFASIKTRIKSMKTHKYYKCPKCKKELRVPKGKGKISITCPNCKEKFTRKT